MISMGHPNKQKSKAHAATEFESSAADRDGETLTSMIEKRGWRHQQILLGLVDVDDAKVINHIGLVDFANSLKKL